MSRRAEKIRERERQKGREEIQKEIQKEEEKRKATHARNNARGTFEKGIAQLETAMKKAFEDAKNALASGDTKVSDTHAGIYAVLKARVADMKIRFAQWEAGGTFQLQLDVITAMQEAIEKSLKVAGDVDVVDFLDKFTDTTIKEAEQQKKIDMVLNKLSSDADRAVSSISVELIGEAKAEIASAVTIEEGEKLASQAGIPVQATTQFSGKELIEKMKKINED